MEVLNRLDSTIAKLIQIKKDMNERNWSNVSKNIFRFIYG